MKIALLGYGKMGHAIEAAALQNGHEIVLRITDQNLEELTIENLRKAAVAIEFTHPQSAVANIRFCLNNGIAVVCGTTGWLEQMETVKELCNKVNGTFLYSSNFSIGVNIFFELNKKLAALLKPHPGYEVQIEETHHVQKKDAPSGTAITLAEQIIGVSSTKNKWASHPATSNNELPIISNRTGEVAGTHSVRYLSPIDDIEIIHTAHNRKGFADGVVLAAEFIQGKKGIFSMADVLGF